MAGFRRFSGLALLWAVPLCGQQTQLFGLISDGSGAAIAGAAVSAVGDDTGFRYSCQSDAYGSYTLGTLNSGSYKVVVRKEGFRTLVHLGVQLDSQRPFRLDVRLPLGSVRETITVTGTPDSSATELSPSAVWRREEVERLPGNARGLLNLIDLAPGTVATPATRGDPGQFTANGQRPNSHYFSIDGVGANSGVSGGGSPAQVTGGTLPGMTAFGSLHNLLPVEAVDEFRLRTSSASAEFGRLPGAHVEISSRSGSDQFHGALFHRFRHQALDANDWFANRVGAGKAPLRLHDGGATLGGPLRRGRTFFFAAYERLRLQQPFTWRSPVPSALARQSGPEWLQPVLRLFPSPNGPAVDANTTEWTGNQSRPAKLDSGSLRIDHSLGSRLTWFGRYTRAPSYSEFGGWQVSELAFAYQSATTGISARLSPKVALDFRANASFASSAPQWRLSSVDPVPECFLKPVTAILTLNRNFCESFFRFSIAGVGQLMSGSEGETRQRQTNIVQTATLDLGRHQTFLGADYRRLTPVRYSPGSSLSVLSEGMSDLLADRNLWVAVSGLQRSAGLLEELSVYAMDRWRVSERLTLTYGLRWEYNPPPVAKGPVFGLDVGGSPFDPPPDVAIWPQRNNNIAPRFSGAYRLTRQGRTVVRAGSGLYFDSGLGVATDLVNGGPTGVWQLGNPANQSSGLARLILGYGFQPGLMLPRIWQWNGSLEHAFTTHDLLSLGYTGSKGRRLLRREMESSGAAQTVRLILATNHGSSDYHGMHIQYRRSAARGLSAQVSYSWSHSIDTASADSAVHWAGPDMAARLDRGASDFDARHALNAVITYTPGGTSARWWKGWSIDGVLRARSGFPLNIRNAETTLGLGFANVFRPDLAPGVPVWTSNSLAPGGRQLDRAAFTASAPFTQGSLGRNAIAGFGMAQVDMAVHREFRLRERTAFQFRVEALNALNQANLADPAPFLRSPLFGQSSSMLNLMLGTGSPASGLAPALQIGGPRSIQVALRLRF